MTIKFSLKRYQLAKEEMVVTSTKKSIWLKTGRSNKYKLNA